MPAKGRHPGLCGKFTPSTAALAKETELNTKLQSNQVRIVGLIAAMLMSTALFGGLAFVAHQSAATIVIPRADAPPNVDRPAAP